MRSPSEDPSTTPATRPGQDQTLAAIAGVRRLQAGVRVADVRYGPGDGLIALARAFPRSSFHGFDPDPTAVALGRRAAAEALVSERVTFELAAPGAIPTEGFDLLADAARLAAALLREPS